MANKPIRGSLGVFSSLFLDPDGDVDQSDFRQVPDSDRGNANYRDRGQRGSYAAHDRDAFPDPEGLKRFTGYGATEAELSQGFVRDPVAEDPAYDLVNYKMRSSQPKVSDEDFENTAQTDSDFQFRGRNLTSRGFLKRPHIPTER